MVTRVRTVSFQGLTVLPVDVQAHISQGLAGVVIVGLPDKAVAESRERIRAALLSVGLSLPAQRITINLSPADLLKEGSHYDLPVALAVLAAMGVIPEEELANYIAVGELALDSSLVAVTGVLATALHCVASECGLICPAASGAEAAWAKGVNILAPKNILDLIHYFKGRINLPRPEPLLQEVAMLTNDLSDVRGQEVAKRALVLAAVGGHNMLMQGAPGAGKSMLASRMVGLLPPLSPKEALETSLVHSFAGVLPEGKLLRQRPFRAPHHSCSQAALVGGGTRARPGEVSLAHHGVLFLDELPEFPRQTLESLRQPIEQGVVTVARVNSHVTFPAEFQLIAAMNPCRCGYFGDDKRQCHRISTCAKEYRSKLSGPLLDRFDLFVYVAEVPMTALIDPVPIPPSTVALAARVAQLRERQWDRQGCLNARVTQSQMAEFIPLTPDALSKVEQVATQWGLSARGYHRVLKVARTIADWDEVEMVQKTHVSEALSYRLEAI